MRFAQITDTVPERCKVAGTWLRPFCLGHHLLLRRLGNPLAGDSIAACERKHLVAAVAICAGESYELTLSMMLSGEWDGVFSRWLNKTRKANWEEASALFRAYLADGYRMPPTWRYGGSGIKFSAPWEQLLRCRLVAAGFAESDVMNGYLPARWYDFFTVKELEQVHRLDMLAASGAKHPERAWVRVFVTEEEAAAYG